MSRAIPVDLPIIEFICCFSPFGRSLVLRGHCWAPLCLRGRFPLPACAESRCAGLFWVQVRSGGGATAGRPCAVGAWGLPGSPFPVLVPEIHLSRTFRGISGHSAGLATGAPSLLLGSPVPPIWIPAFAGMTRRGNDGKVRQCRRGLATVAPLASARPLRRRDHCWVPMCCWEVDAIGLWIVKELSFPSDTG